VLSSACSCLSLPTKFTTTTTTVPTPVSMPSVLSLSATLLTKA
jgi:hypothetical protein